MDTTVNNIANVTGGIGAGNFIESDIDSQLFRFNNDDTPLMNLMLRAKRVKVNSPEVDHYMIDEPASYVTTVTQCGGVGNTVATLNIPVYDRLAVKPHFTLLVEGVDGYDEKGKVTPGRNLMLYVTEREQGSNNPIVIAVNGERANSGDETTLVPTIPKGARLTILANSLYETQKEVEPDLMVPQPTRVYLQKRGMNQVVSDYFESQKKRIPFTKSVIAEQAIANFKVRGNRTLWAGRGGKFVVSADKMGLQTVYTTEGVRWQIRREMQAPVEWTVNQVIALAKMFFTGEDVPRTAILLAGKNLLEAIQHIDYTKHPEIQIAPKVNSLGWTVTNFHTVFGDIEIKREPTLDGLGWSNSGALIGENRLVHYVYSSEHTFSDRVDGEEAVRSGVLIWDALALKGSCHIWIDGEGTAEASGDISRWSLWESAEAPSGSNVYDGARFYLVVDCPGMSPIAKCGQMWEAVSSDSGFTWRQVKGEL
ncbi:MAG: hypothetical protein K2J78_12825 [Muribaculaceae bacterium]|nr:hypothetical protein [Muribaculaceae bacterium]